MSTLGEIGEIKQNTAVVMRIHVEGDPARAQDVHWRGIVLTNFDGHRWFTPPHEQIAFFPDADGEYSLRLAAHLPAGDSYRLHYTVLMEPIATDAIFVAPRVESLRGRFANDVEPRRPPAAPRLSARRSHRLALQSFAQQLRKSATKASRDLPHVPPAQLRKSPRDLSRRDLAAPICNCRALDPRIQQLADDKSPQAPRTNTTKPRTSSAT